MTANGKARFGTDCLENAMHIKSEDVDNNDSLDDWFDPETGEPQVLEIINSLNSNYATSLVQPPETTSSNSSKATYRGRFMAGKEEEYESTLEAYAASDIDKNGKHVSALKGCRTYAMMMRDSVTGDVRVNGDSCRDRWCPMCAGQRAAYAKDQVKLYIDSLKSPKFLTLTLRHNTNDLKTQIEFLQNRFSALRNRAYWKKNVFGGVWFLQAKRGSGDNLWHPHLHILLDSNRMEQGTLSDLWKQVTYGSPVLDIRYVRNHDDMISYVARYTSRPAMLKDSPLADQVEIIQALFRKRLSGTFGNASMITLTPPKVEADGDWDYIGHYDDIVERATYCPLSKAILIAYNNFEPLPEKIYEKFTGHPIGPIVHIIPPPKVDRQLWLDFYNSS